MPLWPATMRSPNIRYIGGVDHLRGIAALWIVAYHGMQIFRAYPLGDVVSRGALWLHNQNPLLALIVEGHTAVGLFLVLSGFILAYGNRDCDIDWWQFVRNRLLRIAPLMIALTVVGTYAFPQSFKFEGFWQHVLLQSNLPGANPMGPFALMFWTIAVEFQFYLVFPFLLRFLRARGLRYVAAAIGLALITRAVAVLHGANPRDMSYWTIVGRFDQFLLGMALGLTYRPGILHGWRRLVPAGVAAIGLVIGSIYGFHRAGGWPAVAFWKMAWPTAEGLVWTAFILVYLEASPWIWSGIARPLCALGTLSFSVYLVHRIVIDGMSKTGWLLTVSAVPAPWNSILNLLIAIPIIVALSCLTYYVIEKPFLDLRGGYQRRQSLPPAEDRLAA